MLSKIVPVSCWAKRKQLLRHVRTSPCSYMLTQVATNTCFLSPRLISKEVWPLEVIANVGRNSKITSRPWEIDAHPRWKTPIHFGYSPSKRFSSESSTREPYFANPCSVLQCVHELLSRRIKAAAFASALSETSLLTWLIQIRVAKSGFSELSIHEILNLLITNER